MAHVVVRTRIGETKIAHHRRECRTAAIIEIDGRLARRFRGNALAAAAGMRFRDQLCGFVIFGIVATFTRRNLRLRRQFLPFKLVFKAVGGIDDSPVINRTGWARRDAIEAEIALVRVNDIVVVVMRDGVDRTGLLTGIAADADLRVDEMLLVGSGGCRCVLRSWYSFRVPDGGAEPGPTERIHLGPGSASASLRAALRPGHEDRSYAAIFTYSNSPGLLSMPTFGGAIQPANLPGSVTGFISASMKSPSAFDGKH